MSVWMPDHARCLPAKGVADCGCSTKTRGSQSLCMRTYLIALLCPLPRAGSLVVRSHEGPAVTALRKGPPSRTAHLALEPVAAKPSLQRPRPAAGLGETHTMHLMWEALLLIILARLSCCEPPPCPIRCSPPPRPVRKRLRLVIGQFTIDVAPAQAGLSHAQHPLKHLPLRSFLPCTHISGYTLVAAWMVV
jgi:hypothetical protein